ncbi:MAG TPA: MarR family transcriptional regulator [Spirochaetales bacterium]|nr:MarR family transcriptional regulator [Spirochaetales bacterium]
MQVIVDSTSGEESLRALRRDLRRIERALERGLRGRTQAGCCGIGKAQCHALLALRSGGKPLSALAKELSVEASTLTRTLDGLEGAGLVRRHGSGEDRRRLLVEASAAGREKIAEVDGAWNARLAEALELIPADKRGLVEEGVALLAAALAHGQEEPCC